jgi:hypothetical protein
MSKFPIKIARALTRRIDSAVDETSCAFAEDLIDCQQLVKKWICRRLWR